MEPHKKGSVDVAISSHTKLFKTAQVGNLRFNAESTQDGKIS